MAACRRGLTILAIALLFSLGSHHNDQLSHGGEPANARDARLAIVRDAAQDAYDYQETAFSCGTAIVEEACRASLRLLEAEMALAKNREDKVKAAEDHLRRMQKLRKACKSGFAVIAYYCVHAEAILADESAINHERYRLRFVERRKLRGKWNLVSAESKGKLVEKPDLTSIEFTAGLVRFNFRPQFAGPLFYEFDNTATPTSIDFFAHDPPGFYGRRAVYQIDNDKLILCWNDDDTWSWHHGRERPTGFDTRKNENWIVYRFERTAARKEEDPDNGNQRQVDPLETKGNEVNLSPVGRPNGTVSRMSAAPSHVDR